MATQQIDVNRAVIPLVEALSMLAVTASLIYFGVTTFQTKSDASEDKADLEAEIVEMRADIKKTAEGVIYIRGRLDQRWGTEK